MAKKNRLKKEKPKKLSFLDTFSFSALELPLAVFGFLLSIFSFFAILSYFFTFKEDQGKILNLSWHDFLPGFGSTVQMENWMGKLGAQFGHFWVYEGIGIAAFLFPFGVFLYSYQWMTGKEHSLKIYLKPALIGGFWLSIFLGFGLDFFANKDYLVLAGKYGVNAATWLNGVLGKSGHFLLLCGSGFLLFVYYKKWNLEDLFYRWEHFVEKYNLQDVFKIKRKKDFFADRFSTEKTIPNQPINTFANEEEEEEAKAPAHFEELIEKKGENLSFAVNIPQGDVVMEQVAEQLVREVGEYDPTADLSSYILPHYDLLKNYPNENQVTPKELEANKNRITETLKHYNIPIKEISATVGPTITLYEIVPAPGIRISKIKNLEDDIALNLAALGIRIIAPMPGKGTIGIEVPNEKPQIVAMRAMMGSEKFLSGQAELPLVLGKTISNETFVVDLAKMPHLLIAGATGQGKSVGINAIIMSLLYKKHPSQMKFVFIDPKKVELSLYSKIERHFLAKLSEEEDAIITDTSKVVKVLNALCKEMDQRYELLKDAQCKNIKEYNAKFIRRVLSPHFNHRFLPYIVLVIDEFADLIMTAGKEVEMPIARLAQLARAIGIHLIVATQRPSVNVITGVIKANFPARIAFRVMSQVDSKTILDTTGAERLIGRGDMLYTSGNEPIRLQCGFIDTPEVEEVVDFIANQQAYSTAYYLPEVFDENADDMDEFDASDRDDRFVEAARLVVATQQGSTSLIQRKLKLGYNRAGRIMDQLEASGIVGPFEGSKSRRVLVLDENELDKIIKKETC